MVLSIWQSATVDAGPDVTICEGENYDLCCAIADNYTSLLWETSGSGIFSDSTALHPEYIPSFADILSGSVILTLNAYSQYPCSDVSDSRILHIIPVVTADAGSDQNISGMSSVTMDGNNPTPGLGQWTQTSGPNIANIVDPTSPDTEIDGLISGTYVFRWTIENLPCVSNWDEMTITVGELADLAITKTATPEPIIAGHNITYTIQVTNLGVDNAVNVRVVDVLPAGLTFVNALPSTGIWASPIWTIGPLNVSSTETLTIVANVNSGYTGVLTNIATVISDTPDPNPDNNADTVYSNVSPHADLVILKTSPGEAVAGDTLIYGVEVLNNGPSNALNVMITDALPLQISNGQYSNDGIIWNNWVSPLSIGNLANAASFSFNIRGIVNSGTTGIITNTAIVDSDTPDLNPANNTSTVTDTVTVEADLCIVKTGPALATPGEKIVYTLYICSGISDALDVEVEDIIPGELSGRMRSAIPNT